MTGRERGGLADRLGIRVVEHGVVDSTMARALADAGPAPALHLAVRQTAGRGRHGRRWESPAGNLHATLRWPEPGAPFPPAVLAAVQVEWARAIERLGGPAVRCKWPNDGWLEGAKWAGLLAVRPADRPGEIHLGLGANLAASPAEVPEPTTHLARHWSGWPGALVVTEALLRAALSVLADGPAGVAARLGSWPRYDALALGEDLVVELSRGARRGRYRGLDGEGRLRLETADGEERLESGEARRVRPA